MQDGDIFIRGGRRFRVHIHSDTDMDPPWEAHDGHGPVRETRRDYNRHTSKRPGERILHENRHTVWLYDWQAACKLARKDGWNAEPFDAPNRIERAVLADFNRLRGWLNEDWWWVGIQVVMIDADGDEIDSASLWGIESDFGDYGREVADELADELLHDRRQAWRRALQQRREQRNLERLAAVMGSVLC